MITLTIRDNGNVSSEVRHLGHRLSHTDKESMDETLQERLPRNLTLHVGNAESLLERAESSSEQNELIFAPVELHRRNIQRRLRESEIPHSGLHFSDPAEVAVQLLETADLSTITIDRIDRLSMIRSVLSAENSSISSPTIPSDPQSVEQIRTEIETVTGFHPERIGALREISADLTAPIDKDSTEILDAAVTIEQLLRQQTTKSVSDVELVRRATRVILSTHGDVLQEAFPSLNRVSLVGVSSIPAAHIDLLHAILTSLSVPVDIHFRLGTGTYLSQRLSQLLDVTEPGAVVFDS